MYFQHYLLQSLGFQLLKETYMKPDKTKELEQQELEKQKQLREEQKKEEERTRIPPCENCGQSGHTSASCLVPPTPGRRPRK